MVVLLFELFKNYYMKTSINNRIEVVQKKVENKEL